MKNHLFPHSFLTVGWILFVPSLILGALIMFNVLSSTGIVETIENDVAIIGIVLGSLFIVCSKERIEDEMTTSIRLASLLKSIYVYVALLIICTLFLNGFNFFWFAMINLVLFPIIFVCIFRLEIHRYKMIANDEE